jgi:hypothetical protein
MEAIWEREWFESLCEYVVDLELSVRYAAEVGL